MLGDNMVPHCGLLPVSRMLTSYFLLLLILHQSTAVPSLVYQGYGCELFTIELECPEGYFIATTQAIYGRSSPDLCTENSGNLETTSTCQSDRALQDVKGQCDGRNSCLYTVNGTALGNPCPGIFSYLQLAYECRVPVYRGQVCEENVVPILCNENEVIKIEDLNFGRRNLQTCANGVTPTNSNCSAALAPNMVSSLCDNKRACNLIPEKNYLGDGCDGDPNYMDIAISCLPCKNEYSNLTQCQNWTRNGECETNAMWMMAFCRKSCTQCDLPKTCVNEHKGDETQCDTWAARGECVVNPQFMTSQCRQSCNRCGDTSMAMNTPAQSSSGTRQAFTCDGGNVTLTCPPGSFIHIRFLHYGRSDTKICTHDSANSNEFCTSEDVAIQRASWLCNGRSSCLVLALPTTLGEPCPGVYKYLQMTYTCEPCANVWPTESECAEWESSGECALNRDFMLPQCFRDCSDCFRSESCTNIVNDDICDGWALSGECRSNPDWMAINCKKSCRVCEVDFTTTTSTTTSTTTTTLPPTTTPSTTTVPDKCSDKYINPEMCRGWAEIGVCELSGLWMKENCYRTCTGCGGGTAYVTYDD